MDFDAKTSNRKVLLAQVADLYACPKRGNMHQENIMMEKTDIKFTWNARTAVVHREVRAV